MSNKPKAQRYQYAEPTNKPNATNLKGLSRDDLTVLSVLCWNCAAGRRISVEGLAKVTGLTVRAVWDAYRDLHDAGLVAWVGVSLARPDARGYVVLSEQRKVDTSRDTSGWIMVSQKCRIDPERTDPDLLKELLDALDTTRLLNKETVRDAAWLEKVATNAYTKADVLARMKLFPEEVARLRRAAAASHAQAEFKRAKEKV